MDLKDNVTSEVRQDGAQDITDNNQPIQGDNIKPIKGISTKTSTKVIRARQKPASIIKRKTLEALFPAKYIENGLNGTKTYQAIRPNTPANSAKTEASLILRKPNVQEALQELLAENNLTVNETMKIHHRNLIQNKNLHVSQTAVQDVYKLSGLLNNRDNSTQVNIAMVIKSKE